MRKKRGSIPALGRGPLLLCGGGDVLRRAESCSINCSKFKNSAVYGKIGVFLQPKSEAEKRWPPSEDFIISNCYEQ